MDPEKELLSLPNIGPEMARCLTLAGLTTPTKLKRTGSIKAAIKIAPYRKNEICRSALCALEGAIRNTRWHNIPKHEREKLWQDFLSKNSSLA